MARDDGADINFYNFFGKLCVCFSEWIEIYLWLQTFWWNETKINWMPNLQPSGQFYRKYKKNDSGPIL